MNIPDVGQEDKSISKMLSDLRAAALVDVKCLSATLADILPVVSSEFAERNSALFEPTGSVGLREFVDAQSSVGGKYAAFYATVGNPFLIVSLLLSKMAGHSEQGARAAEVCADVFPFKVMLLGDIESTTELAVRAIGVLGLVDDCVDKEESQKIADDFFLGVINEAVELAYTRTDLLPGGPAPIHGDSTPGLIH